MKFTLTSDAYSSNQLIISNILKQSKDPEIRGFYKVTDPKNIEDDTLLHQDGPKNPKDRLVNKTGNKILDGIKGLKNKIPSLIPSHNNVHVVQSISQWQKVCKGLPQNIFIFVCVKQ